MTTEKRIRFFLMLLILGILSMVSLGGITRLTGSGLSIVEWQPITGIFPPFSQTDWQILFQQYQLSPEFVQVNAHFTLADFQRIFWLEYLHRLVGRALGLLLLIPTVLSWRILFFRRTFIALWILGGLQGVMGWWMVKSGLIDNPWVSPFRLTAHLFLALLIFSLSWIALLQKREFQKKSVQRPAILWGSGLLIFMTILWGGLVAGTKAGLLYNTFLLMDGKIFPDDALFLRPFWLNFFENPSAVQWMHRVLAFSTLLSLFYAGLRYGPCRFLAFAGLAQVTLGALTVLGAVPLWTAVAHQLMAFLLWGLWLWVWVKYGYMRRDE